MFFQLFLMILSPLRNFTEVDDLKSFNNTTNIGLHDDHSLEVPLNLSSTIADHFSTLNSSILSKLYNGYNFTNFRLKYARAHGYLSCNLCIFGIFSNIVNIIVMSQDKISSTTAILRALAVADMMAMASYLPYSIHYYICTYSTREEKHTYPWATYHLFQQHCFILCHIISIWLTVFLGIWRFLAVCYPLKSRTLCTMSRAKWIILCIYLGCIILCVPAYLLLKIIERKRDGEVYYLVRFTGKGGKSEQMTVKVALWIFCLFTKLIPFILLTGLSISLIKALYRAKKKRQRMQNMGYNEQTNDKTTRMLLAILFIFFITEIPQGILALLTGIYGKKFFDNVHFNFLQVTDLLSIINSAVNFILYCSMSKKFRDAFTSTFSPKKILNFILLHTKTNNNPEMRHESADKSLEPQ